MKGAPRGVRGAYRALWPGAALALAAGAAVAAVRPEALLAAAPVIALWVASPLVALLLGRPFELHPVRLEPGDAAFLRGVSRRTWAYFETTVGESGLPPDNLQTEPELVVARRTSPTNVGTYLLSALAARDFGWIGTAEMAERIEIAAGTLERLPKFHGHLFNWYDTGTLEPLRPRYVSTVDSGNLAGHLWALAQGCRELAARPLLGPHALAGVADAVALARPAAQRVAAELPLATVSSGDLERALAQLDEDLATPPATAEAWDERLASLADAAGALVDIAVTGQASGAHHSWEELVRWARATEAAVASHARDLAAARGNLDECPPDLAVRLRSLAERVDRLADAMDFAFLYDRERKLFPIGYRVEEGEFDTGYYDLLASEAHLASFVAIAKGDVPVEHWFHLGRTITPVGRDAALVSWSGSMFEYLMPALVLEPPPSTILERTQRLVVGRQIRYGAERGVPWGISESAYNARDRELTYQYSHFGIPGLGLTRGLVDDLVVAPYATALAAMVDPAAARRNFERLTAEGALGPLGYYEALDYTPSRVPKGEPVAIVRAYMSHHAGMTIVALGNVLSGGIMRRRFHDVPRAAATELLLQERIPRDVGVSRPHVEEVRAVRHVREIVPPVVRTFRTPWAGKPRAHLLSNGRYTVMLTASGSGFSRRGDQAVTRWRPDATRDAWGSWVFLRDVGSGDLWSAGYQPTGAEPDRYEATFSEDRVEIRRVDGPIETTTEIVVSPEDDGELRRVTLKNLGAKTREIELTSYAEVVLAPPAADLAHPAFSKLFVETEHAPAFGAILARRRPRAPDEDPPWAVHVTSIQGETVGAPQYETDRARLLDRGRSIHALSGVVDGRPLSQTVGPVLDPVFALRRTVRLRSGETARVVFATLIAPDRETALELADKYDEPVMFERAASLAWTRAQVELQHLGVTPDEARLFQRLAGSLVYPDPDLRAPRAVLAANARGQRELWKHGISGDLPIVHVTIDQLRDRDVVRQLFRAHEYWGGKGLAVDVVVVNEHEVSYGEDLQRWLERSVERLQARIGHETHGAHGSVYLLRADQLAEEERDLLRASAAVVLRASRGKLVEQLDARETGAGEPPPAPLLRPGSSAVAPPRLKLAYFNGLGGFAEQGREYVIVLGEGQWTPAPWVNVIANPHFGFIVSESGAGYTWAENSRENRLTPWSNDPVEDSPGEALYVRDEETGEVWTPTALPIRAPGPYVCRHGAGYSRFEHRSAGIALDLLVFAPLEDPVRIARLTLRNESGRRRRLSVTAYVEWVLGAFRETSASHVVTEVDESTGAIFARNRWSEEFAERVAFADLGSRPVTFTCDRTEFLGRTGALDRPAGMRSEAELSGAVGGGMDPCAALRAPFDLAPGASAEVVFLLGQAAGADEARHLVTRYRKADLDAVLERVHTWWDDVLGTIQVRVPDSSMGILLNRWLLYQALACRVWARSAFYQSGGAYGFRDQLQDVMALTVARRGVARAHLLRAAAQQFPEGDVLHWWHPPSGRGVRTRIMDDRLWLPYALSHYLAVTGDTEVLEEPIPFLAARPLEEGEMEAYIEPEPVGPPETLFEHCARAVDVSLQFGPHGLPLIGAGDWNDGMNRVGLGGQGESVWLGWFLHAVLAGMIPLAEARGESSRVERWQAALVDLRKALEEAGWDGGWYRRAYFDDGTPLGSSSNQECRIDSIAQSWAVMSEGARPDRAAQAMRAVEQYLVRPGDGLVLLFTPPFDAGGLDPGYIQGYPPGVRENGGQYTHAAIWTVIAKAILGEGDAAAALFSILNPINQASTRAGVHRYKVEPYVAVADVYASPSHVGRGGWTWYTGSAGWMYRAGIEWILGFRLRGTSVELDPCIPRNWEGYELTFRYHSARYKVVVSNPHGVARGVASVSVDGAEMAPVEREGLPPAASVELVDDGREHEIGVVLGYR
ncbi:MAG TPA: glucoamylase family protein [Gemmatimonadota bacterium]|nr:glucoamylase family protein [Gemmatimonadota bacterium]